MSISFIVHRASKPAVAGTGAPLTGVVLAALLVASPALAAPPPAGAQDQEIAALRQRVTELESQLAALRAATDERLSALERSLAELRQTGLPAAEAAPEEAAPEQAAGQEELSAEERADLEREMAAILGGSGGDQAAAPQEPAPSTGQRTFSGHERNLNQLNPEISVAGDLAGNVADRTGDPEANQFRYDEFEVAFQSTLDPFSTAKAFVVHEGGEFDVEEAYVDYTSLPGKLGLKVGAFRNDWGKINRWHQHGLPQVDRPLVHQAMWGEEGLRGIGVGVSWLPPRFLGSYNEITLQVTNDQNDASFTGRGFDDPVVVAHETNYFDLSSASYLELGLSAANGLNDPLSGTRTQVYGMDLNYSWVPPARALYRGFEARGEVMLQRRGAETGLADTWGAYAYGTYKLDRRWSLGSRFDWTQIPGAGDESLWGVSPYLEWWQSEWAQLRFQFSHNSRQLQSPDPENRFFLQIVWAIGPHKHEKY